jgi:hypothetical protein
LQEKKRGRRPRYCPLRPQGRLRAIASGGLFSSACRWIRFLSALAMHSQRAPRSVVFNMISVILAGSRGVPFQSSGPPNGLATKGGPLPCSSASPKPRAMQGGDTLRPRAPFMGKAFRRDAAGHDN